MMHVHMLKHQQAGLLGVCSDHLPPGMGIPLKCWVFVRGISSKTGLISGFGIVVIWSESIRTSIFACQETVKKLGLFA